MSLNLLLLVFLFFFVYHDQTCFELMWKNRWRCHSLAFWCHSAGSYCYLCSPTPFSKFKCPPPPYSFRQLPIPSSCLSHLHYPAPHLTFYRSRLSHLPTFLSWGAGSSPSLLSLQVFLVADGAHAVGAGVTIETTSHSAKHWHLRLIGLLSHALTEGVRGMGEDIPENGVAEVSQNDKQSLFGHMVIHFCWLKELGDWHWSMRVELETIWVILWTKGLWL